MIIYYWRDQNNDFQPLAKWLNQQRVIIKKKKKIYYNFNKVLRNKGKLSEDKVALLEELGIIWKMKGDWDEVLTKYLLILKYFF